MSRTKRSGLAAGLLAALLVLGAGRIHAASLPVAAAPSWEGFYIGGDVGSGFGMLSLSQPNNNDFFGNHGFIGGLLAGYNHMVAPRWLVGIEGDASWSGIDHNEVFNDGFGDVVTLQVSQNNAYSVRGRLGYLVAPGTVVYATGGWAWSQFTYSLNAPSLQFAKSDAHEFSGPQVGAGVETMLGAGWDARLEYLQSFYNSGTFNSAVFGPIETRPSVGVARLALIYRFGSGEARGAGWEMPAATPSWNGAYVGGALGAGVANAKVDFSQAPGSSIDGLGIPAVLPIFLVGYNWRVAPRWVVGIENGVAPGVSTADFQVDWTDALHGRLGYLLTPATLVYGSAGWLTTGIRTTSLGGSMIIPGQRVNALQVGGGIEAALTGHWAARVEYDYAIAAAVDNIVLDVGTITGPVSAHAQMQSAQVGVVYMFDGR